MAIMMGLGTAARFGPAIAGCALVLTACGAPQETASEPTSVSYSSPPPASEPEEPPQGPYEACYSTFAPTGDAKDDLARLVRDCGATGGMRPVTSVVVADQAENDPVDRYTFDVPTSGKCYRVYAAGNSAVKDLDLLLVGPSSETVATDVTRSSWPVLPPKEPACLTTPGSYRLEVSVYRGAGNYALQIWGR